MIALIPILAFGVLLFLWWTRRGSGVTRLCRWRQGAISAEGVSWRCSACGAQARLDQEQVPRQCLRPR